jgi:hypothetical protein
LLIRAPSIVPARRAVVAFLDAIDTGTVVGLIRCPADGRAGGTGTSSSFPQHVQARTTRRDIVSRDAAAQHGARPTLRVFVTDHERASRCVIPLYDISSVLDLATGHAAMPRAVGSSVVADSDRRPG